ncbi:cytochrome C biogenesis DsbD-like protein [Kineococcus xinjiangensis]|uniref:Cytochrome C biogenesis DsbD-like protein n=1 Tax=Kineococcus xinjiangensis TaxID=512762 RepID=A0A2S6IV33_9ACTN|nr:sulfite exporter TauE/SafE family protein [Kineococcus xinjiangensis]PPK98068.1 cytochrome C biogenesis DsbD-like protein [Kineococcus xinjiangensis]
MLSSITPLGERGRAGRWPVTAAAHLLGSALGGTALGALLGLVGWLLPLEHPAGAVVALAGLAALAVVALAVETGRLRALPTWHRQVDEDWLHRYRGWVYGFGYGVQLGVGVVTIVTSPLLYAALALAVLTGGPAGGAVVGLAFGAARALPVLSMRRVTTPERLVAVHRRLEAHAGTGRAVAATTSGVLVLAAAAQLALTGALS